MGITGTKSSNSVQGLRNYFINTTTITEVEVMDSQYTDMSLRLSLKDKDNDYSYTCFVNQNFEKDLGGVVSGLKYPDDLNTLFLATDCDLNVSDTGILDTKSLESLVGKDVSCITYKSNGKYKRNTWGVVSHPDNTQQLESRFKQQLSKGYPKDFAKEIDGLSERQQQIVTDTLTSRDAGHEKVPF